ncbi:MAG: biotin--[acetyl-CoA-carboxylase] ligase [Parachlamydiaceae bacterium]
MKIIKEHLDSIPSTNTWALQQAHRLKEDELFVTTTDQQTHGRGRYGHQWISAKGLNICATYSFLFPKKRLDIGNISQVIALSAIHVLETFGITPVIKWPNDILIQDKKIAGILGETASSSMPEMQSVVLGIGININMPLEMLIPIGPQATSLYLETGKHENIEFILNSLTKQFLFDLSLFFKHGFNHFLNLYRKKIVHKKGNAVTFHANNTLLTGFFDEITDKGTLKLCLCDGSFSEFVSGEITNEKK